MHPVLKWATIFGLLLISIAASIFMVLESGAFYQKLYPEDYGFVQLGFLAASLNEVFMSIMAGVWLPGRTKKGKTKGHPINFFFRMLLILLFVTTVGGASFNLVYSKFEILHNQNKHKEVIQILQSQIKDNKQSLKTFIKQNQRVNSVLAVRQQHETKEKLMKAMADSKNATTLWFEIFFIILLRFGVQLANLSCVWIAGWIYRNNKFEAKQKSQASPEEQKPPARPAIAKSKAAEPLPLQGAEPAAFRPNLKATPSAPVELKPVGPEPAEPAPLDPEPIEPVLELKAKDIHLTEVIEKPVAAKLAPKRVKPTAAIEKKKVTKPKAEVNNKAEQKKQNNIRPLRPLPKIEKVPVKELSEDAELLEEKESMRKAIRKLLQNRNEGISLSQFSQTLGVGVQRLEEIFYTRIAAEEFSYEELESIHQKLERLYEERYAI